jgi:hypothetical protein
MDFVTSSNSHFDMDEPSKVLPITSPNVPPVLPPSPTVPTVEPTAPDDGVEDLPPPRNEVPPSALSDHEELYLPFLQRLVHTSSNEISSLSIKEFIAAVFLGHHTQMWDMPYMSLPFVPETEDRRHICFLNRCFKGFQLRSHEHETGAKKNSKTCPYGCLSNGYRQHLSGTTYVSLCAMSFSY